MLKTLLPSMFHRRLLLLFAGVLLAVCILFSQLLNLAVVQGDQKLADAERVLSTTKLLPTVRGSIVDRKGRVLASDEPYQDILVDYRVISGQWAYNKARKDAYRKHKEDWPEFSFDQREALIDAAQRPYDEQTENLWAALCTAGDIDRTELERRKATVIRRVQMIRASVLDRQARRYLEMGQPLENTDHIKVREEVEPHTLLPAVDDAVANYFKKRSDEFPGLTVDFVKRRDYRYRVASVGIDPSIFPSPLANQWRTRLDNANPNIEVDITGLADHALGSMRNIYEEDVTYIPGSPVEARPYRLPDGTVDLAGYLPGDRRGSRGVEAVAEAILRGTRGREVLHLDSGQRDTQPPVYGKDVQLTLDIRLQARIQAMLQPSVGLLKVQPWHHNEDLPLGTPLNAGVVVLDVETSDVLAMVTTPADMNADLKDDTWPQRIDEPVVNRAIGAAYPPGSTIKPIIYALTARENKIATDQHFTCNGQVEGRTRGFRCWIYKMFGHTHGELDPVEAIARSCNIYFFNCGRQFWITEKKAGVARMLNTLREFGFDRETGIGLPGEISGFLPYTDRPNRDGQKLDENNAMLIGIGQGPITATPLQVATAHAVLARDGVYLSPVLMEHQRDRQVSRDLGLSPAVLANTRQGMFDSANATHGTGYEISFNGQREKIFNLPDVAVSAKTGTAQAPRKWDDTNGNRRIDEGEPILRSGSHSWYVCHVGLPDETRARYIVVVVVEYGGSGGRVSGPVANQVIHLLRAEGYL